MKKLIFKLFLVLLLTISVMDVNADDFDVNRLSNVTIKYSYGDKNFSNKKAYLYKVATVSEEGIITYTYDFKNITANLKTSNTSELNAIAVTLDNQITQQDIAHIAEQTTNTEGLAQFTNLATGVYLLKIETVVDKDYQYKSVPMIISAPLYNSTNEDYNYDFSVMVKTEAKYIGDQVNDGNTTNPPNTVDQIMIYSAVFIISLICIIGLVCYIKKIKKEGRNKNEKENN